MPLSCVFWMMRSASLCSASCTSSESRIGKPANWAICRIEASSNAIENNTHLLRPQNPIDNELTVRIWESFWIAYDPVSLFHTCQWVIVRAISQQITLSEHNQRGHIPVIAKVRTLS